METDQALLDGEVDAEASPEPEEQQAEADPLAELAARVAAAESEVARLKGLDPAKIGPALGRVSALQSQLDALKDRNPAADFDPRISAAESVAVTLAQALMASDLVDDRFKQSVAAALNGIEQANSERQQRQLEATLEERITKKFAQVQPEADSDETLWEKATYSVIPLAQKLNVDPSTVPWLAIRSLAGNPTDAVAMATQWLYENQTDPATKRVAERQRAVGNGSPPRSAAAPSHADIIERYANGDPTLTSEEADKAMKALGL